MRVGSFFNIDIYANKWLVAMMAIALILGNGPEIATIFLVIFIHETAHVLTAKLLGLKVSEIELLPFGGAVRIESIFELEPLNEILIAIAGPLINILMILAYTSFQYFGLFNLARDNFFLKANLTLAGFNLLPALPLDGGRILRALLSREIGIKKSTQIVANGGLVLSLFVISTGIYALYYKIVNPTFFITAVFLAYSALKEKKVATFVLMRDITYKKDTLNKKGFMPIREIVVIYDLPLKDVMKKITPNRYHYIQVVDEQLRIKGWVSENQLVMGLIDLGSDIPIIRLLNNVKKEAY